MPLKHPVWQMLMGMCLLVITALLSWRAGELEPARQAGAGASGEGRFLVAVDPGHGGRDPGKVGADGQLECVGSEIHRHVQSGDHSLVIGPKGFCLLF